MKRLYIILLTTGVALFLALAGCGGNGDGPEVVPEPAEPEIAYARDIAFDSLTAGQVRQLLQSRGKWKVEALYMSPVEYYMRQSLFYYPPDSGTYIEFTADDSLRFYTDTGVVTEKIVDWLPTSVGSEQAAYEMPGISNYRLILNTETDRRKRFYCLPEAINLKELPQPDFSQNVSLDGLPVYQMIQILSGTKWKIRQGCFDGHCSEAELYVAFEFVGTNTFRIIRDSVARDYEIGVTVTPGINGFLCSYSFWEHYPSLEEAGELISIVVLSDICNKQMTFRMSFANAYDFPDSIYHCVLVE
jgi:hypothetical protein